MKIFLCLFLLCFSLSSGQDNEIDSLKDRLSVSTNDTTMLNTYYNIISYYSKNDINSANKYLDTMLQVARNKKLDKYIFTGYSQRGVLHFRKGEYSEAINIWKQALEKDNIDKFSIQMGNLYHNISVGYKTMKKNDSVVFYVHKSIKLNKRINNKKALIANYYTLSDLYANRSQNDSATKYLKKLEKIALENDYDNALMRMHILLANISRREYDLKDAIVYFEKALKFYDENDGSNMIMLRGLEYEIIKTYIRAENYKVSVEKIKSLKHKYFNGNYDDFWLDVDANLLGCYNLLNNTSDGYDIYSRLKNKGIIESITTKFLVDMVISNYELLTNTYNKKTLFRLENALKNSIKKEELETQYQIYNLIAEYQSKNNNYKKAIEYLKKKEKVNKILNDDKILKTNLALKRKFSLQKKERENLQLIADKAEQKLAIQQASTRNRLLIFGLIILFIILFFFWRRYNVERKAKQVITSQKNQIEQQKQMVEMLQKELHHRMKNNLSFIDLFINLAKGRFTNTAYQNKLNDLQNRMRSMFEVHKQLFKKEDVTAVKAKSYIDVLVENVKQAYNDKKVSIINNTHQDETLLANTSFPVGLIVNEFVTNSYKYAFEDRKNAVINISLTSDHKQYQLSLTDNGKGLPDDFDIDNLNSFGLETIQLLTQEYKGTFQLDGSKGMSMCIKLPKIAA